MKILRIISSMNPVNGGPCEGIRNSIPAQDLLGVENEVVCFDHPQSDFLKNEKLIIHALGPSSGPYAYCKGFKSWLQKNICRFNVVVIHGIWLYNSFATFQMWQKLKSKNQIVPKLYVMPHGMLDPYFQKEKKRKLKAIRNWFFWKLVERRVINGVDGILFTCEQELLLARITFKPYRPKNEINIGYGIKLPPPTSREYSNEFFKECPKVRLRPYWLFLSRIHSKKGVDILIKAYLKLKSNSPNIPDLVIAGPGSNTSFGKSLKPLVQGANIYFPGMLKDSVKWGAFYNCEAFILPSHQENFGIAVVEALGCGKPVLISDQINIWKEIESAKAGLICKDTEEGIFAMLKYWTKESNEKKREMSKNAFEVFQKHFAIEEAAKKMVECVQ